MLARLLLALLALVFATPVTAAACHAQPAREHHAGMSHHGAVPVESDEAAAVEACVGCVPPSNWIAPRVAEPLASPAPVPAARALTLSIGRGTPPALPPPRVA